VRALIAARHLMRAAHLRKHADVDVLDVSARDTYGHDIFRLAGSGAGMTPDTAGVIDDLRPLNAVVSSRFLLAHLFILARARIYHAKSPGAQINRRPW